MRDLICRAAVAAGAAVMLLGPAAVAAGAGGPAAASREPTVPATVVASRPLAAPGARAAGSAIPPTIYVVDNDPAIGGAVVPVPVSTNVAGQPILMPDRLEDQGVIAITPDGAQAYVYGGGTFGEITPIQTSTNTVGQPIVMDHNSFAMTPDGKTLYVSNAINGTNGYTVTPITTATNIVGSPIHVGTCDPGRIGITPDSQTAYVACYPSGVVPIHTADNTVGKRIPVKHEPASIVFTPNGATAYVQAFNSSNITPIFTATNTMGAVITVTGRPFQMVVTPDGTKVYVLSVNSTGAYLTPILTATNKAGKPVKLPAIATGPMLITPGGKTIYIVDYTAGTVLPFHTVTGKVGKGIIVGPNPGPMVITPNGSTLYVLYQDNAIISQGFLLPIQTSTNTAGSSISIGNEPAAMGLAP